MTVTRQSVSLPILLLVACLSGTCSLHADSAPASSSGIVDVSLTPEGSFTGQLLASDARPVDGAIVVLRQNGADVAQAVTDTEGRYMFSEVAAGVYQLQVGDKRCVVRIWQPTSAPPAARTHLIVVRDETVVRGQSGNPSALYGNPGRLAGLGMVGLTLGTITLIGIEATENEQSDWISVQNTMPPTTLTTSP